MRRTLPALLLVGLILSPAVPLMAVATLTAAAPPTCSPTGPAPTADPVAATTPPPPAGGAAPAPAGSQSPAPPGSPGVTADPTSAVLSDGAGPVEPTTTATPMCVEGPLPGAPPAAAGLSGGTVADPTGSGGFVTRRTAHLIAVTRAAFPTSGWACWSPRPGTRSEHPLGRACDVTFGNPIGQFPTAEQVAAGWTMTLWLQAHADSLGVEYLIWQGRIWSSARSGEGWRPYTGGGMHDPTDPTGGHYDHLHITIRSN